MPNPARSPSYILKRAVPAIRKRVLLWRSAKGREQRPRGSQPVYPIHTGQLGTFRDWLRAIPRAEVLELGTRRSIPERPTHHREWAGQDVNYIMSDFQDGLDVDVLADAHALTATFHEESFDAVIACSVLEHIQRPWIAAQEIARVLKPGGKAFVQTHQCFPLHGYPNDYWRFTTDALETIFGDAGLAGSAYYEFPCYIVSTQEPETKHGQAFLNVCIVAERP